jgi:hypothetical protein
MLTFHNTALFFDLSFTLYVYSSFVPSVIFYPPNHCVLAHIIARFSVGRSSITHTYSNTVWQSHNVEHFPFIDIGTPFSTYTTFDDPPIYQHTV